jgi:hypothetical protein
MAYEMLSKKRDTWLLSSLDDCFLRRTVTGKPWTNGNPITLLYPIKSGEIVHACNSDQCDDETSGAGRKISFPRCALGRIFVNALERRQNRLDLEAKQLRFEWSC